MQPCGAGLRSSFVEPNPAGYTDSIVYGVYDGQQVGYAHPGDGFARATIWYGSNKGFTNLSPGQGWQSFAQDTNGRQQVGSAGAPGDIERAVVWTGTAESLEFLSDYLPEGYDRSYAMASAKTGGSSAGRITLKRIRPMPSYGRRSPNPQD